MGLVVAGMILITPLGEEPVHTEGSDAGGSNLRPVAPHPRSPRSAAAKRRRAHGHVLARGRR
jgi:hypothetical protein